MSKEPNKISLKNTIKGLELLNEILGCCELKAGCDRSLVLKNTSELLNLLIYCDQVVSAKFDGLSAIASNDGAGANG